MNALGGRTRRALVAGVAGFVAVNLVAAAIGLAAVVAVDVVAALLVFTLLARSDDAGARTPPAADAVGPAGGGQHPSRDPEAFLSDDPRTAELVAQDIIDAIPKGVAVYDGDGVLVRANRRARELGHLDVVAEAEPRAVLVDRDGAPRPWDEHPVMQTLRSGHDVEEQLVGLRSGATVTWRRMATRALAPRGGRPSRVVAAMSDVTDQVAALEALDEARVEADRANLAKTEFMSRLHHELRTPLNAVYTAAQLLDERELPEQERRIAARILKGCRLAIGLMEDMREISLIEDGHLRLRHDATDVAEALSTALAAVHHLTTPMAIKVRVAPVPAGLQVWADPKRLAQVLVNLLGNAVRYNRPSGTVDVRVEATGGRVRIAVQDTGRGIPAGSLQRIFEPFERLDAAAVGVDGTGLGLSISRRLVETMDGRLEVESTFGVGSTFTVDLAQAPTAEAAAPVAPTPSDGRSTVLYIEDNPDNVELMQDVFERWPDLDMAVAMTGGAGLRSARQLEPALILLDLHLPDIHGLQVLEGLRADPATAAIPVIMVTADATGWEQEVPAAQRPDAIVTKPLDVKAFTRVVSGWVGAARS